MDDRKLAATLQQAKQYLAEDLVADGATVHPRSSSTSYLIHVAQTRDTPGSRRALARFDAVAGAVVWRVMTYYTAKVALPSWLRDRYADLHGYSATPPSRWQRFRDMIAALWSRVRGR